MGESGNKRKLSSRSSSFLKVLDGDFSSKLTIPQTFIENFNRDIPSWFLLEIAGSRKGWRVDTKEDESGGVYFAYGWNEFVEEHSLEVGDFLFFEYEQPLILQVRVFEKDGTEKTTTNSALECAIESSDCRKQSPEIRRVTEADLWSTTPISLEPKTCYSLVPDYDGTKQNDSSTCRTSLECEVSVVQCTFRYVIQKQYFSDINTRCEGYKMLQRVTDRIAVESDDQCWIHEKHPDILNNDDMETDYSIGMTEKPCEVNDSTVVETDDQFGEYEKQLELFDKVFATEKGGLCYVITWRKVPHLYYYLTFPREILTSKALSNNETVILKDQEGNSWPIKLRARHGGRVDLALGWKEFLIKNDVSNGDILTFEFVSDKVIHIKIERTIERVCQTKPPFESDFQVNPPFVRACPIDPHERANEMKAMVLFDNTCKEFTVNAIPLNYNVPKIEGGTERDFVDDFTSSSFSVTWREWHSAKAHYLHIPKAIAKEQKLKNKDMVLLCDPEGIQWPVKIRLKPSDGRVGLAQGWSAFWRQHKLSYGDTLAFEFVSDRVVKVNITRVSLVNPSLNIIPDVKQEVIQLE